MNTQELYTALIEKLDDGWRAAVRSRYDYAADTNIRGHGGAIHKELITEDDQGAWTKMNDVLTGELWLHDGPVSRAPDSGGLSVIEKYSPKPRMIILGGGHIALALAKMAKLVDFYILVCDDRPAFANNDRFPEADQVICEDFSLAIERLKIRPTDYIVIVTRGHTHDAECLEAVLNGIFPAYAGMIGSMRRVAIVMKELADKGHPQSTLDEVHSPIGLRIGAVTPAEIAISILSEIIEVRRKGKGVESGITCNVEIAEWLAENGENADAMITILSTSGSVPRETGAKMALRYEGQSSGTIGGGCAEGDVIDRSRSVIREGGFEIADIDTKDTAQEDGMACGGFLSVVIEKTER